MFVCICYYLFFFTQTASTSKARQSSSGKTCKRCVEDASGTNSKTTGSSVYCLEWTRFVQRRVKLARFDSGDSCLGFAHRDPKGPTRRIVLRMNASKPSIKQPACPPACLTSRPDHRQEQEGEAKFCRAGSKHTDLQVCCWLLVCYSLMCAFIHVFNIQVCKHRRRDKESEPLPPCNSPTYRYVCFGQFVPQVVGKS